MTDSLPAMPYPYVGPEDLRQPIERALMRVIDPEVALSIVDVGLVYGVTCTPERLHVRVTMTSAACPVADMILEDIESELDRIVPEGVEIAVELVWEPPWSTDRMSPRAKAFMGW